MKKGMIIIAFLMLFVSISFAQLSLRGIDLSFGVPKNSKTQKLSPEEREMRKLEIEAKTLRLREEIRERKAREERLADSIAIEKMKNDAIVAEAKRIDSLYEENVDYWNESALQTEKVLPEFPLLANNNESPRHNTAMTPVELICPEVKETRLLDNSYVAFNYFNETKDKKGNTNGKFMSLSVNQSIIEGRHLRLSLGGGFSMPTLGSGILSRSEIFFQSSISIFGVGKEILKKECFLHVFEVFIRQSKFTQLGVKSFFPFFIMGFSYHYDFEKGNFFGGEIKIPLSFSILDIK